jgi:hypothetical protein
MENKVSVVPSLPLLFIRESSMNGADIKLMEGEQYVLITITLHSINIP